MSRLLPQDGCMVEDSEYRAAVILTRQLVRWPSPRIVRALAEAIASLEGEALRAGVAAALEEVSDQTCIDAVCAVWAATRHPALAALLTRAGWVADTPPELRVLTALLVGQLEALTNDGAEVVSALLDAAGDSDTLIAGRAEQALRGLRRPAAQEEVCRLVMEEDNPLARAAAVAVGYAPRDPQRRALFYLLTEQWAAYEQLDFDASLLRTIYEMGDDALRRRIADYARRAGRLEFVEVVAGGRLRRRLGDMTHAEWEIVLALLTRSHSWPTMWQLAQLAPPVWSARLLRQLHQAGWQPAAAAEAVGYAQLTELAARCVGVSPPLGGLLSCQAVLEGHTGRVLALACCPTHIPEGNTQLVLASGSRDGTLRLWSLPDGAPLRSHKCLAEAVEQLAVTSDGRWLVSGCGRWVSSGAEHAALQVWQLPEGQAAKTFKGCGPGFALVEGVLNEDGQWVVGCGGQDGSVRLLSLPEGKLLRRLKGHQAEVTRLAVSPPSAGNGLPRLLVTGSEDQTLRVWSLPDGVALKTLAGHSGAIWSLAISPDGRWLASGSHDRTARVWSLPEGQLLTTLKGHTHGVSQLAFCEARPANGEAAASLLITASSDNTLRLWQLPEGVTVKVLEGRTPIAISPDGSLLVSGHTDGGVWLWQLPEGLPLKRLAMRNGHLEAPFGGQQATCLAFSLPNLDGVGPWLIAGSSDGKIWVWASELVARCRRPVAHARLEDMTWAQETWQTKGMSDGERGWLELLLALLRWRWRFDIHIEEAPQRISVGEFDIEIEE